MHCARSVSEKGPNFLSLSAGSRWAQRQAVEQVRCGFSYSGILGKPPPPKGTASRGTGTAMLTSLSSGDWSPLALGGSGERQHLEATSESNV